MTVAAEKGHLKFAILLHEKAVVIPMFGHANIWIRNSGLEFHAVVDRKVL